MTTWCWSPTCAFWPQTCGAASRPLAVRFAALLRLVQAALDHGLTTLDTAPLYGLGAVEETIGVALRQSPAAVQVATKCGIRWDGEHGARLFEANAGGALRTFRVNGLPASVREEVHASLLRLGLDCIDVVQLHQYDAAVPLEDTLGELVSLRREGKLKAIGVSNFPLAALSRAERLLADGPRLFSTQDEYNGIERRTEPSLAFAREHGVQFWAYSPLAGGALAGRHSPVAGLPAALPQDHRGDSPVFEPENLERLSAMLSRVARPLAERRGATLAQLALAWLLSRPGVSAAIVGGSSEQQIRENARSLGIALSPAELAELDRAFLAAAPRAAQPSLFDRLKDKARRALGRMDP
jgi:aryl-alcohol dehydrogenase-like predicted oxidoreductase